MRATAGDPLAAPFQVFVLVCDRDKSVPARAVLAYQRALEHPPRDASPRFRQMLDYCRENYPALWREYAGAKVAIDLAGFVELMTAEHRSLPRVEFAALERELTRLAKRLFRASIVLRPRLVPRRAHHEFLEALRDRTVPPGSMRPRAQAAEAPVTELPAPAPSAPSPAPRPVATSAPPQGREPTEPPQPAERATTLLALPSPGEAWVQGPIRLVCTKITDEARDVKTFSFVGRERRWFHYKPGQFLTIEPVIDGRRVSRSYTISSTPSRPALLEITVKRVLGGVVSNWLHDHMKVGQELDGRGPFGKFSCLDAPRDKYLFLAAGSGTTPLMSMLRYLHDVAAPVDVVFLQSARTENDVIFRKELLLLGERAPGIRIALTLTDPPPDSAWDGLRGRLDNEMLQALVPDVLDRMVLACGPVGFVDKAKQLLAGNGFPLATQFDEESFVPKHPKAPAASGSAQGAASHAVRFVKSGTGVEVTAGETILDAVERCGLSLASACRQGRCGTCRVVKVSGEVSMADQEALSPDEIAQGEILACIALPGSATVEVDL